MSDTKVMPDPSNAPKCPQCSTPLPTGSLAGLCPACLLQQGAAADTVTDGKHPPFNPPPVAELAPLFPQLEILELIGKGGMGAVYKARQKQLDRIVALKILPPGIGDDPAFAERFAREAKALAKLNHPGIVTLYEFGSSGREFAHTDAEAEKEEGRKGAREQETSASTISPAPFPPFSSAQSCFESTPKKSALLYYFLMEFVDGVNLRQLLQSSRVSPREALAIVPQICDALQFAHDQGIVHRDIKPENILLDRRGRVKVADFGLAKIVGIDVASSFGVPPSGGPDRLKPELQTGLTDAGKVMGTPNYMAPEQVSHPADVDHRADIYALGVVFYQMLTGELPGQRLEPPSSKVQIDVRLDEVVLRALEKNPELRYQQVSEVKTCVETIVATGSAGGPPAEPGVAPGATRDGWWRRHLLPDDTVARFAQLACFGAALVILIIGIRKLGTLELQPHELLFGAVVVMILSVVMVVLGLLAGSVRALPSVAAPPGRRRRGEAQTERTGDPTTQSRRTPAATSDWPPIIRRALLVGLAVWIITIAATAIVTFMLPVSYLAETKVLLRRLVPAPLNVPLAPDAVANDEEFRVAAMLIPIELVLGKVVEKLNLNHEWGRRYFRGETLKTSMTLELLKRRIVVRTVGNSSVISICCFSENSAEAAELANATAESYVEFRAEQVRSYAEASKARSPSDLVETEQPLLYRVTVVQTASPPLHPARPNRPLNIVLGAVAGLFVGGIAAFIAGLIAWRKQRPPGGSPAKQIDPALTAPIQRHGRFALGLFLAGILGTLLLMTISPRHEMALIFGGVALLLAFVFGVLSWRERLGKFVVVALASVLAVMALAVPVSVAAYVLARRAAAAAEEQRNRSMKAQQMVQLEHVKSELSKPAGVGNPPSAYAEAWSPTLAPGEKPDPQKILGEANVAMEKGRYEEALHRHLWYHNHALEYDPGQTGVRLSFALSYWMELGRRYPKARQALFEMRDAKTREFDEGRGSFALFHDVASMNNYLQEEDATYTLFKSIAKQDPTLARQCYLVVEGLLLRKGEYALCLTYIGDLQARFESIQQTRKLDERMMQTNAPMNQAASRKSSVDRFATKVVQLIEVLVATGHKADAEKIRNQAVAVLDVPELQSAVSDAERKVAERKPVNFTFGPVAERTLPMSELGYSYSFDLDSDMMQAMPAKMTQADWQSGITLPDGVIVVAPGEGKPVRVAGTSTQVEPLRGGVVAWENLRANEIRVSYELEKGQTATVSGEANSLPLTFAFRTQMGTSGLLQVTGFTDNPRGVKIRYKLVLSGRDTPGSPSSTIESEELRKARARLAELRSRYTDQHPLVREAMAKVKKLEGR